MELNLALNHFVLSLNKVLLETLLVIDVDPTENSMVSLE